MAQAPQGTPAQAAERFQQILYVGVGVDRNREVLTTEAEATKQEAVDNLLEMGCTSNSIRIFELDYDIRLHSTDDIPLTRLEVR
jgi:hypothetical protein